MKLTRISFLFLLLFLFVPHFVSAQNAAEKAWKPFWTKFSTAIKNKNRVALKGMMARDFQTGGYDEGDPRDAWLKPYKGDAKFWRDHQQSVAKGTKSCGKNCRVTTNNYLVFEYQNGRWLWTGLYGD
jgi:hypothetical protein